MSLEEDVVVVNRFSDAHHYFLTGLALEPSERISVDVASQHAGDVLTDACRNSSVVNFESGKWIVYKAVNHRFYMSKVRLVQ